MVRALSGDDRVLVNALALPQVAPIESVIEEMERAVSENTISGWKTFTHFPTGIQWWMDDHDPDMPQVGNRFIDQVAKSGSPILFVHKGLSDQARYGSPEDIGPAARAHPDVKFVVYHSGFEVAQREGPFTEETAHLGVNRLIDSVRKAGIGPGENVYAEIGSTWWHLLRRPDEAAHVLGKLLVAFGEDNVLWGTDSIFYGSPQGQIDAMRAFQIPADVRDRYGYPELTRGVKAKILGWNAGSSLRDRADHVTGRLHRRRVGGGPHRAPGPHRHLGAGHHRRSPGVPASPPGMAVRVYRDLYRSTSPITGSSEAMVATVSAIRESAMAIGRAWRLENEGARVCIR